MQALANSPPAPEGINYQTSRLIYDWPAAFNAPARVQNCSADMEDGIISVGLMSCSNLRRCNFSRRY
ncbi:unnamed protein product [Coffea canephora]|uniref:Uncharacterized protein n=1 Tax=Coffea canephora TaxID=49390 RepID=A0A068TSI7_COFCA|nr:unnamed protein product [Coffea canephora]